MKYLHLNEVPWNDYQVIGFDMDGTLYNEEDFVRQAYSIIAKKMSAFSDFPAYNIENYMIDRWQDKGSSYPFIFSETISNFHLQKHYTVNNCLEDYRAFKPNLRMTKQVEKFLDVMSRKDYFLITDGTWVLQNNKFHSLGLDRWFNKNNVIFTGEHGIDYYKPSIYCLKDLEGILLGKDTIYLGDRKIDEEFAHKAGFDFLKVKNFTDFWSEVH